MAHDNNFLAATTTAASLPQLPNQQFLLGMIRMIKEEVSRLMKEWFFWLPRDFLCC
jgi:hypothetical protein